MNPASWSSSLGPGSAAAGLPGWKRLVELLSELARTRGVADAALQEIAELTAARQFIDALSALKDCLGAPDFCTAIERHLDDRLFEVGAPKRRVKRWTHRAFICALNINFLPAGRHA